MAIIWTDPAKSDLADIYDFQTNLYNEEKAWTLVQRIIDTIEKRLSGSLSTDMPDLQFQHLNQDYRKILVSNYKVTFRRAGEDCYVVRVFDQRRFPDRRIR